MPITIVLIIVSLVLFVYYKVQQAKSPGMMQKRWYSAKGSIAVGIFFISFGINAYNSLGSQVAAYVAVLFVGFGLVNVIFGTREYRRFLPLARKEAEEIRKETPNES
ncbi:MAG: YtpI family protein [Bacillus sp. (in: Bacteria)]|nr:YtpI family protein [Bacillus sp. (in: firmicutes)]